MSRILDLISPAYVGEEKIKLSLAEALPTLNAFVPVEVLIDTSAVGSVGVSPPLELVVRGPTAKQVKRQRFETTIPSAVVVTPDSGGTFVIIFRELYHNRYFGRLTIQVEGSTEEE